MYERRGGRGGLIKTSERKGGGWRVKWIRNIKTVNAYTM